VSVLQEIFAHKAEEVAEAKRHIPLSELQDLARGAAPPRGFRRALESNLHDPALIAEIKKASPSQGVIRSDFDPSAIARMYESVGAAAVSVLTDQRYFHGSSRNLLLAHEACTLPCLRKDFVNDQYQVVQSRAWGADAILLIVAALEQAQLLDLHCAATELGMDVLVEVHNEEEAERALESKADLIGVNNRNLKDLSTDLAVSDRILPKIAAHCLAVSESALSGTGDVARVKESGARAVLIGTSFCAAPNVGQKVREVMGW
jgi:indole-3-glycerol phosphate synthase